MRIRTHLGIVVGFGLLAAGCSQQSGQAGGSGGWVTLFDGKTTNGWKPLEAGNNKWVVAGGVSLDAADNKKFAIQPGTGVLVNGAEGRTSNLLSEGEFGDCDLHIEWVVPKGSNSGVYFEGMYEIQILDSFGKKEMVYGDAGGIYARWINEKPVDGHPPTVNVSKAPGEWQTFDATFRAPRFDKAGKKIENARFVKVTYNGTVLHENVNLTGPTRASLGEDEKAVGPFMLQGDHGPVAFRNVRVKPLKHVE